MENVISEERATEILNEFFDWYNFDVDVIDDEDTKPTLRTSILKMKRAIRQGLLEVEVTDTITITQNLKHEIPTVGKELKYKEIDGSSKVGIKDSSQSVAKVYMFLGALCGEGLEVIQKLKGPDLSLAEALGFVFLQI